MSAALNGLFLNHPLFKEVVDLVLDLERRTVKGEQLLLPICGPSRVGKTFAIEPLKRHLAPRQVATRRVMPMLYVKTPAKPSLSSLPRAILQAAGLNSWASRGGPEVLTTTAIDCLKRLETRIVVVDEFQHLAKKTATAAAQDVSDWFKNFLDQTGTSAVLLGTPPALKVIEADDQFASRGQAVHHLLPYCWSIPAQREEFEKAADTLQRELTNRGYTVNVGEDLPLRLAVATGVRIGMTIKLLNEACNLAGHGGVIDNAMLARAFKQAINKPLKTPNPFAMDVCDRDAVASFLRTMRNACYDDEFVIASMADANASQLAIADVIRVRQSLPGPMASGGTQC